MHHHRRIRQVVTVTAVALSVSGSLLALTTPAFAGTAFTSGDVVVYRVGDGTTTLGSSGASVSLDEYSPTGTLVQSVPLPTAGNGSNKPLVAGGTATSEGELTLSADGQYLMATGYDSSVGTSGLSASAAATVPRTVARVDSNTIVDTTTALTDFADANNPRSATSSDGTHLWVGGAAGGVRYTTLGSSTSTALTSSTFKNVREVSIVGGQLYTSADPTKASVTVATVGTGLPTSGTQTPTDLPGIPTTTQPYEYVLLTLGSGAGPDTVYLADDASPGATATATIDKFSRSGSTWVAEGSVTVGNVLGLTGSVVNGQAVLYATSSANSGQGGTLTKVVDSAGAGATMSATSTLLATAPANEAFRGVAFAPVSLTVGSGLPETPYALLLPGLAGIGLAGFVLVRRRRLTT